MKLFKTGEFRKMKDPTPPGKGFTKILTGEDNARDLEGIFVVSVPGRHGRYHYHKDRECIFIILNGKATARVEGKEFPIEAGDIMYLAAGEKHTIIDTSTEDLRFIEFFTNPPHEADWIPVKEEGS